MAPFVSFVNLSLASIFSGVGFVSDVFRGGGVPTCCGETKGQRGKQTKEGRTETKHSKVSAWTQNNRNEKGGVCGKEEEEEENEETKVSVQDRNGRK